MNDSNVLKKQEMNWDYFKIWALHYVKNSRVLFEGDLS